MKDGNCSNSSKLDLITIIKILNRCINDDELENIADKYGVDRKTVTRWIA